MLHNFNNLINPGGLHSSEVDIIVIVVVCIIIVIMIIITCCQTFAERVEAQAMSAITEVERAGARVGFTWNDTENISMAPAQG